MFKLDSLFFLKLQLKGIPKFTTSNQGNCGFGAEKLSVHSVSYNDEICYSPIIILNTGKEVKYILRL